MKKNFNNKLEALNFLESMAKAYMSQSAISQKNEDDGHYLVDEALSWFKED